MEVQGKHVASAELSAVVTRADGTVEDLGVIDSYKRPWWRTLIRKVTPWKQS